MAAARWEGSSSKLGRWQQDGADGSRKVERGHQPIGKVAAARWEGGSRRVVRWKQPGGKMEAARWKGW